MTCSNSHTCAFSLFWPPDLWVKTNKLPKPKPGNNQLIKGSTTWLVPTLVIPMEARLRLDFVFFRVACENFLFHMNGLCWLKQFKRQARFHSWGSPTCDETNKPTNKTCLLVSLSRSLANYWQLNFGANFGCSVAQNHQNLRADKSYSI